MIPAGILDSNVELFANGKQLMAIHNGEIMPFRKMPMPILRIFIDDMLSNTEAIICLNKMGLNSITKMLEQYCWCRFGGFDGVPDLLKDKVNLTCEYWDCGKRGDCPYQFILCDKVTICDAQLTKKQVEIVKLIATGKPDKIICDEANVTYYTLTTHKKNIYAKLGTHSQAEITALAYKHNLIS